MFDLFVAFVGCKDTIKRGQNKEFNYFFVERECFRSQQRYDLARTEQRDLLFFSSKENLISLCYTPVIPDFYILLYPNYI